MHHLRQAHADRQAMMETASHTPHPSDHEAKLGGFAQQLWEPWAACKQNTCCQMSLRVPCPVCASQALIRHPLSKQTSGQASTQAAVHSESDSQPALLHRFRPHLWLHLASTAASSCPWTPTADKAQRCTGCPHALEVNCCCFGLLLGLHPLVTSGHGWYQGQDLPLLCPPLTSGCCWSLEHGRATQHHAHLRMSQALSWSQAAVHWLESCSLLQTPASDLGRLAEACHQPAEEQSVRLCCGEERDDPGAFVHWRMCWVLAARPQS